MKEKVSIIICAYNEENTIENVIRTCSDYNSESELIVIDDGSSDSTPEIIKKLNKEIPFKVHIMPQNKGKSNAMVTGVEMAGREIILFFDADVSGIQKEHFNKLLTPLFSDEKPADMVLGSPSETLIDYRVNPFKSLTGERAMFKKDLLPILEDIRNIRFGVETYINLHFQANGKKIRYTLLDGLTHPNKYDKTSTGKATKEFISEGKEIAVTLLNNYDLITKRISKTFDDKSDKLKDSMVKLQDEINDKIHSLIGNNG